MCVWERDSKCLWHRLLIITVNSFSEGAATSFRVFGWARMCVSALCRCKHSHRNQAALSHPCQDTNVTSPRLTIQSPPGGLERRPTHVESLLAWCEGWKGVRVVWRRPEQKIYHSCGEKESAVLTGDFLIGWKVVVTRSSCLSFDDLLKDPSFTNDKTCLQFYNVVLWCSFKSDIQSILFK